MVIKLTSISKLKIVIIHDNLLEYGGAERVLEELLKIFPKADLFTFYFNFNSQIINNKFHHRLTGSSFLTRVPGVYKLGKYFSIFKTISWIYFYFLNLKQYDLIISISYSYNSKIVRKSPQSIHLCYLLTPPRYLYFKTNELEFLNELPWNFLFFPLKCLMIWIDKVATKQPDIIISISKTVADRAKKIYYRNSTVIYPPTDVMKHNFSNKEVKSYYIFHSRLVSQKGVELAILTCNKYNLPLKIIGDGYLKNKFQKKIAPNINFLGFVKDKELATIYAGAKALIYCAQDEDFGLVPVEAMSYGVPVVAYRSGGVIETVIDGKTGVFFDDYSPSGLYTAIERLNKLKIKPIDCYNQARKFNSQRFKKEFLHLIHLRPECSGLRRISAPTKCS